MTAGIDPNAGLASLEGRPLWGLDRAADLLRLQFGARRAVQGPDGTSHEVGELAVHVAAPWRLRDSERILTGSGDLLTPADADADLESFDWDEPGASWLDIRLDELRGRFDSGAVVVESARADPFGGLELRLSGDLRIEVFPTSTPSGHVLSEFWRLFVPGGAEPHLVVGTFGVDLESET